MHPVKALEAFVKLFADDTELRKSFGALEGTARKAGTQAGLSFSEGLNRSITQATVTPRRAGDARPLQLPRVGGREVDLSSPFSTGFQRFKTARELATLPGPGGIVPGPVGGVAGGGRGLGGGGRSGILGSLGQAGRAAGLGGIVGRFAPLLANPVTAGITAGTSAVFGYVSAVKAAQDAERELARAREAGNLEGVTAIFEKSSAALRDYNRDVLASADTATGFEAATRRALAGIAVAWAELRGRGAAQLTKEAEAAEKAATDMWRAFGSPKLATEGLKRQSDELARSAELAIKAAGDTMAYSAATDMLVRAKQRAADAEVRSIEVEMGRIRLDLVNKKITEAEATDRLADAEDRRAAVGRKLAQDEVQIEQDRRRKLAEFDAAEIEHTATIQEQQRLRRDAVVSALGEVIETEGAANVSLRQLFRARAVLQAETTKNAIDGLKAETAARRQALEARLSGATGEERVRLERDLTRLTEEESTKRTQIEAKAAADRLRLARQTQQELLAQTEQVFSIQRTLGQRSLQDDLARFAAIANAARAGSKTQLDALARVASAVKAMSDQARQFLTEALSASDQVAQQLGRESPEFVSLDQLAQDAAARMQQLEEAQRTLEFGGSIRREDFQALAGGQLDRLRAQREAGRFATAAEIARTSVDAGQGFDAFQAGLGGGRNLARPESLFRGQLGEAFTEPDDLFRRHVGGMSRALEELVTSADADFKELEAIVDRSMTVIEERVQRTSSTLRTSLRETIKTDIARELDRDSKLY